MSWSPKSRTLGLFTVGDGPVWDLEGRGVGAATVTFFADSWGSAVITMKRSNSEFGPWSEMEEPVTHSGDGTTPMMDVQGFRYLRAELTAAHGSGGAKATALLYGTPITAKAPPPPSVSYLVSGTFVDEETPAGAINDINTAYTLASAPSPAASLQLYLNGQLLLAGGIDYTLVGDAITMTIAPFTGDYLRAWYRT